MKKAKMRPDGRVEIKRVLDGKRRSFYGRTKSEAERAYQQAVRESVLKQQDSELFERVAEQWWLDYSKRVKPGTQRAYHGCYQRLLDAFSGYRMDEISPGMIENLFESMKKQDLALKTAQNTRSCLSLIYSFWRVQSNTTYTPLDPVRLPRGMKRTERLPPSDNQEAVVRAHPEGMGLLAWVFMYTGCRLGEALALQWRDVNFDTGEISITKSVHWENNRPVVSTPKTKNSVRVVPLLRALREKLDPRRASGEEYIFGGSHPLTQSQYAHAWLQYCRSVGLVERDLKAEALRDKKYTRAYGRERIRKAPTTQLYRPAVTAHQFRHLFATSLYEAGVDALAAQKILGHADLATTQRIYTHVRDSHLAAAAAKLEVYMDDVSSKCRHVQESGDLSNT